MKKIIFLFITLFFTNIHAFNAYSASYILSAETKVGEFQIGTAVLDLKIKDNQYTYTSEAKTDSIWEALYDYSRSEISTGYVENNQLIVDDPAKINSDPENEAWFFKLKIKDKSELDSLMNKDEYDKFAKESAS